MPIPQPWQGEAYNQVPESENRIHSDEVARTYGFKGGLVPGVTVTAYLCHPAVETWGLDWLERGRTSAVASTPLYDRKRFRVELSDVTSSAYGAVLIDEADRASLKTRIITSPVPAPALPASARVTLTI